MCRALLAVYSDAFLQTRLAFRGGTALYKLCLLPPARYSEDLDFVQIASEPIRETLDHLHDALDPWLGNPAYKATANSAKLFYRFSLEEIPDVQQRLKIEINTREHAVAEELVDCPFIVNSRWISGEVRIRTFSLETLLGTKLRALYQRSKGRDLFDIDYALQTQTFDADNVIKAFVTHLARQNLRISTREFLRNLQEKIDDPQFCADIPPLLRPDLTFDLQAAHARIKEILIARIDDAWISLPIAP